MPEGDTVHKLAAFMDRRLAGRPLRQGRARALPELDLTGREIERARAVGKHLWLELAGGGSLRSHLGLHGTWHRYAPGEAWRKPERQASIVLSTDDSVWVCFHAREVAWREAGGGGEAERRLGPDLVQVVPEPVVLVRRIRAHLAPDAPLVDLLLDQRVACGIGNVYKSEVLFLERRHPLTQIASLSDDELHALYRRAHPLLRANLGGGARVTRDVRDGRGTLWVYARGGLACFSCGATIQRAVLGRTRRSTYWCPECQRSSLA